MNHRIAGGSLFSCLYNSLTGLIPSRTLRTAYLKAYLGKMGSDVRVQTGCKFLNGRKVFLGDRTIVNFGCLFDGRRFTIRTGHDVSIGPEAAILTLGHDPRSPTFADKGGDVVIGDYAWIAFRAIIMPGVVIGEGSVIGAGSVVTKNVAPYTIVAGNPARVIGTRPHDLNYSINYRPWLL